MMMIYFLFKKKNEVCSQFSSISLFFIITKKKFRTFGNTFTMSLKPWIFLTLLKKILLQRYFPYTTSIFDTGEVKEEYPMKYLLNRQKINQWGKTTVLGGGLHFTLGNIKHLCLRLK